MEHAYLKQYVKVILGALSIRKGDRLFISTEPAHWDAARLVAEAAYRAGAVYVDISAVDPSISRIRLDNAPEEALSYVPDHLRNRDNTLANERWAYLSIGGPQDPFVMEGVDQRRNSIARRAAAEARGEFHRALVTDQFPWLVVSMPTDAWARQVMNGSMAGSATADGAAVREELWKVMAPILKLDEEDPGAAWSTHAQRLKERSIAVTNMHIDTLHITGPDTDLTIGLPSRAIWLGGYSSTPDGRRFLPNVPTEEVFTAPDFRRTNGHVRITRPVMVLGTRAEGVVFTFENGLVTGVHADKGQDALESYLQLDTHASAIGEVALVDAGSSIARSGKLFFDILYDENAACHFALGSAYPSCLEGGETMTEDELYAAGLNTGKVHLDFMFGSDRTNIVARDFSGNEIRVMEQGTFADPSLRLK
ncbi:MAG TPA: aminopeptidase [Spirochaetia bacterium]|nr:aminopeptidase [Spirochaetia bacterium]